MFYLKTSFLLQLTAGAIALELAIFAGFLMHRKLFHWKSAGFWAWSAFLVYFVFSPLALSLDQVSLDKVQMILGISEGTQRGLWVLLSAAIGIALFFITYLRTRFRPVTWGFPSGHHPINLPVFLILTTLSLFGFYSLLIYRAGLFSFGGEKLITEGRFVGSVTGYQNAGYMFLFMPIILLLLSQRRLARMLGWILAALFLVLSVPHAWSRYATVSFILALSLVTVVQRSRRWPGVVWVIGLVFLVLILQIRGHAEWSFTEIDRDVARAVDDLPEASANIFRSSDVSMLQSWYASSYLYDEYIGYDYGLPPLNYLLTGWIPSRIFPNKYFMIDWLNDRRGLLYPPILDRLLYGSKSSMLGSFYAHGGLVGILFGCMLAGYLSRRLDGMFFEENSAVVRSVAIAWVSVLWMVWGSGTTWSMMTLGILAIPALIIKLFTPKARQSVAVPKLRYEEIYELRTDKVATDG